MAKKQEQIIAYKAFDKDFKCRDFQYEIGKEYTISGNIKACGNGFHACENPFDVLDYYNLIDSRFGRVIQSGDIDTDGNKHASAKITVEVELKLPEYISSIMDYLFNKIGFKGLIDKVLKNTETSSSEFNAQLAASGSYAKLAASGDSAQLAASGSYAQLAASGDSAQLAASGSYAKLAASGSYAKLAASGDSAKLAASGDSAQLAASGSYAQLAASGSYAQLAASGDSAQLAASGSYAKLAASGYNAHIEIQDKNGVFASVFRETKFKGVNGTLVCLVHYADDGKTPLKFVTGTIGKGKLKADIWYCLDSEGKFKEYK